MKHKKGKAVVRKAFICPDCEGVYADQPTSSCDCCGPRCLPQFAIRGTIRYDFPAQYGERPEPDLGSVEEGYDLDALLKELGNLRAQNAALASHLGSCHVFIETSGASMSGKLQLGEGQNKWTFSESQKVLKAALASSRRGIDE